MRHSGFGVVVLCLLLAACGGGSSGGGNSGTTPPPSTAPSTQYDMANDCFALKSVSANAFAVRDGAGYAASSATAAGAEPFYMKPTALGQYLFHAKDKSLLATSGGSVGTAMLASPAANWAIDGSAQDGFTILSESAGQSLAVDPNSGALTLAATGGRFQFVPATGCTPYPEISTDSVGETYKGRGVGQPVIGFAEVHTHMAMGHEMSDGSRTVGPSAGGAMYGQMFHRFGVPHALEDCAEWHGTDGSRDPEATVLDQTPLRQHDTQGWPTFIDWPARDSQLHQGQYYKWVERAWKAGLRVMVSEGTNIEALCEVAKIHQSTVNPAAASTIDCDDMTLGINQVKYLFELEKYVDAQEGGPGKGWFRIVKDPFEARRVINDGKLAVVPGLEFSNLFQCGVTFGPSDNKDGGTTDPLCTEESIVAQIDEAWDLGVRELFPYHDVNSALGGTGIFQPLALNLVGFWGTHRFWDTYDCPDDGEGEKYFYNAGSRMYDDGAPSGFGDDPLTGFIVANFQGLLPVYSSGKRQCNARGTTPLGRFVLEKLMEKKFIIDIDHAELSVKQDMIDLAKTQNPKYPLISAHGGHGGISMQQARDILELGGLIYPFMGNGREHKDFVQKLKPIWPAKRGWPDSTLDRPIAVGYGMDNNGIANRASPRGMGATPVQYPFVLFDPNKPADWGPKYSGITPITFNMQTVPESGKFWNIDEVGMAHYGLAADFVEEVRLEGGREALDALYNSAEAYLQMWEQTVCRGTPLPAGCPAP